MELIVLRVGAQILEIPKKITATNISVLETLKLFDEEFLEVAAGVAKAEYALWLGSGISRERVADLRVVARRVLDYLSVNARAEIGDGTYKRALDKALGLALTHGEKAAVDQEADPATWANIDIIVERLVGKYALLLDTRIQGQPSDHLVWDIIDVRGTYADDQLEPDCEHTAVAVLVLEGVFPKVASANWDGLVEKAVATLSDGNETLVNVLVRAEDIAGAGGRALLHKFHGCAVQAKRHEAQYREYIVGRDQQITDWPNDPKFALMKNQLEGLSVTHRTLMIGLSAQDSNIKDIFSVGRAMLKRAWPSHPPAYVFAGDELGAEQGTMLKSVYQDDYDDRQLEIEKAAKIPAYGKPLLTALVLSVLGQKFAKLIELVDAPNMSAEERTKIIEGVIAARNLVAAQAGDTSDDKRAFMDAFVGGITRSLSIFRGEIGGLAKGIYGPVGVLPIGQMANDPYVQMSSMPELGVFLGIAGLATDVDGWRITPVTGDANMGSFSISGATGNQQKMFVISNNETLSKLIGEGVINEADSDTIVAVCSAPVARRQTNPSSRFGRGDADNSYREFSFKEIIVNATSSGEVLARLKEEATL
ncbi:hypothetical protein DEM27_30175 [Metarhizobium album]|uniref:Uncharacterized protein n=1 Tax=Metarhizobium album TaxID=2182425 RepID=A0A2U2DH42_9HYPH|nr:hypothetical protein DEM27_30175 [Rhizobium album]